MFFFFVATREFPNAVSVSRALMDTYFGGIRHNVISFILIFFKPVEYILYAIVPYKISIFEKGSNEREINGL